MLGAGFMLIEVALLQRFVLLLGHPVYSLTVTLFSVLLGTGIGSLVSRRISDAAAAPHDPVRAPGHRRRGDSRDRGAAAHHPSGDQRHATPQRIALTVLLIAPAGVLMGMPLPAGIRLMAARDSALVPWAWGMNGALSVIGATLAVFIAMNWGFSVTLMTGAAIYLTAAVLLQELVPIDRLGDTSRRLQRLRPLQPARPLGDARRRPAVLDELRAFQWNGRPTTRAVTSVGLAKSRPIVVETFVNEFWTSKQRAAHSLHEVSYRACFKPQLPRFFIDRFTAPGDVVYDPFMGRGTTVIEAALAGRTPAGCDINPLSAMLAQPRLSPPTAERGRAQARGARSVAWPCRIRESSRCSTTPTRSAKSARCANICWRATARDRSTASIGGFGWWRSTG